MGCADVADELLYADVSGYRESMGPFAGRIQGIKFSIDLRDDPGGVFLRQVSVEDV